MTTELAGVRARLAEAEQTLRAIRGGEVDALLVAEQKGGQVFTLEGAEHAYRILIESMNEGALMLAPDKTILFANRRFAAMVKCPLEQVTGGALRRFLSHEDRARVRALLKHASRAGAKIQVLLNAADGAKVPAQISIRALPRNGNDPAPTGVVVTDMTEVRRTEKLLRDLAQRILQAQETERGRVAVELHDNITQLLCAISFRSKALLEKFSDRDRRSRCEAKKLSEMLGEVCEEVERISRNLRPSLLDQLGLSAILRETTCDFADRTRVPVALSCVTLAARMPADTELALYRILQEALRNVEKHARAGHVAVCLRRSGPFIQLAVSDDGIGFDTDRPPARRKGRYGLGLLGMRERAGYVGGVLKVTSVLHVGTQVEVSIPR